MVYLNTCSTSGNWFLVLLSTEKTHMLNYIGWSSHRSLAAACTGGAVTSERGMDIILQHEWNPQDHSGPFIRWDFPDNLYVTWVPGQQSRFSQQLKTEREQRRKTEELVCAEPFVSLILYATRNNNLVQISLNSTVRIVQVNILRPATWWFFLEK